MTVTADTQVIPATSRIDTGPVRKATAAGLLGLAGELQRTHGKTGVHQHLQDAADQVRVGNDEGALRHIRAAAFGLQPQSLRRHGMHDDRSHLAARRHLEGVLRHHLLVGDLRDAEARNQAVIARQAMEDAYGPPVPSYGGDPGALAQRPVARQPGGDRALNAPARTSAGRPDPNVADPVGRQPRGSRQFGYDWDDLASVVELAAVQVRPYRRTVQTKAGPRVEMVSAHVEQRNAAATQMRALAGRVGGSNAPAAQHIVNAAGALEQGDYAAAHASLGQAQDQLDEATLEELRSLMSQVPGAHDAVDRSHIRGWIPQEKWLKGQQEWVARGKAARAAREAAEAKPAPEAGKAAEAAKATPAPPKAAPKPDEVLGGIIPERASQILDNLEAAARQKLTDTTAAKTAGPVAERPNTVIQPDEKTGELREWAQGEYATLLGKYAQTLPQGSAERAEVARQAMDVARGGPEWQRLKQDSDPLRPLVAKAAAPAEAPPKAAAKATAPRDLHYSEIAAAYKAAHGREAPKSTLIRWAHSGPNAQDRASDWYKAGLAKKNAPPSKFAGVTHAQPGMPADELRALAKRQQAAGDPHWVNTVQKANDLEGKPEWRHVADENAAKSRATGEARADTSPYRQGPGAPAPQAGEQGASNPEDKFAGVFKHAGSSRLAAQAEKEHSAGRHGNAIGLLEKADGLEAHEGVMAGKGSRQKIAGAITKVRAAQAAAIRKDRAEAAQAAAKAKEAADRTLARTGRAGKMQLLTERTQGADRASGEMRLGDRQEGHQAVDKAPAGILPNDKSRSITVDGKQHTVRGSWSDPWWMAKPDGTFAISRRWQSPEQDAYDFRDGKYASVPVPAVDERVLTPWTPEMQKQAEDAAVKAVAGHGRYQSNVPAYQRQLAEHVARRERAAAKAADAAEKAKAAAADQALKKPETPSIPAARLEAARHHADWMRIGNFEDGRETGTGYKTAGLSQIADFGTSIKERPTGTFQHPGSAFDWRVSRQRTEREGPDARGQHWEGPLASGSEPTMAKAKSAALKAMKQLRAEHIAGGGDVGYQDAPTGAEIRAVTKTAKATPKAPARTFEDALKASKGGIAHASDAELMAAFAQHDLPHLVGAVSPKLVWQGAQRKRMTTKQLAALAHSDPMAVSDLQWEMSWGWDDLGAVIALSARTPMLESTPAPLGRPGGPGLYRLRGNKHSDYLEQVTKALIEKRGMPKSQAYAVAWAALRRWRAKSRHPEVRTAASAGLMQEAAAAAKARAAHAHASTWDDLAGAINLAAVRGGDGATWDEVAAVVDLAVVNVKTYQRTVNTQRGPVVQTIVQHPQNYRSGTGQAPGGSGGSTPATGKATASQPPQPNAGLKQQLLAKAAADRRQAAVLALQVYAYNGALYNALYGSNTTQAQAGATTTAQKGATTTAQAGATTTAQKGATTATATVSAAATAAAQAGLSQAQITAIQNQASAAAAGMSVSQLQAAISQMTAQIGTLNAQAAQYTAQAARL